MRLSDREWGEFELSDIFKNYHGKRLIKENRKNGNIPLLTATENMQGISSFISNNNMKTYVDFISIDMFGHSFYHNYLCCGDDNIYFFINNKISNFGKLFIVSCINKNSNNFSYGKQFRQHNADKNKILLPTTPQGTPDYDFMEDYIKELMSKKRQKYIEYVKEKMEDLRIVGGWGCVVNDREWREFRIEELFNVSGTITTHPSVLIKGGNIPRITCSATNNGLDDFYKNTYTENGGVITVDSATVGFTSYQNYYFIATDHVEKIFFKNGKKMNYFCGLFIKQAIDSAVNKKYNYGYKFSQSRIKKQIILLPTTPQGTPDYEFMENYTKRLIYNKLLKYLEYITKATKN